MVEPDPTARETIEGIKSFITIMGTLDSPEPKWDDSEPLQISYIDEEGDEVSFLRWHSYDRALRLCMVPRNLQQAH